MRQRSTAREQHICLFRGSWYQHSICSRIRVVRTDELEKVAEGRLDDGIDARFTIREEGGLLLPRKQVPTI